jgi:hypothetical protein
MKNIRDIHKEKVKKIRSERYNAEVVNVCAAPRTLLIFRTFFFGSLESGEGNKISPHKTSRPTLFKEITWCVLKQKDNVVFVQTSSSKAVVHAAVSILHVIMTLSLTCVRTCVRASVCTCKERNAFLTFKLLRKTEQNIPSVCPFARTERLATQAFS